MPNEYEYAFLSFDKTEIINKLKKHNAVYVGTFLFRVQVFKHPTGKKSYIRVRDEGKKTTMTYKYKLSEDDKFPMEHEVIINNFDEMVNILLGLGCETSHYYEKIREIWNLTNSEIVFDTYPMLPDIMEIEAKSEKELNDLVKLFELKIEDKNIIKSVTVMNLYGFDYIEGLNTTFNNIQKYKKLVKESKEQFNILTKYQLSMYKHTLKAQNKERRL